MRTLRWRLTLLYGGLAVAIIVILAAVSYLSVRESLISVHRDDVKDTAASASQILDKTGSPDSAGGGDRAEGLRGRGGTAPGRPGGPQRCRRQRRSRDPGQ